MVESSAPKQIKVALIGGSGAIGREVVRAAQNNTEISELALLVRRTLPEWK